MSTPTATSAHIAPTACESTSFEAALAAYAPDIIAHPRVQSQSRFMQHGTTSVLAHEHNVAWLALRLGRALPGSVDERSMTRGALLHDYFLYDWHDPNNGHPKHATEHPQYALANAMEDFNLNETEQDVIAHHMFPLTRPPRTKEGALVCTADKIVALDETLRPRIQRVVNLFKPRKAY